MWISEVEILDHHLIDSYRSLAANSQQPTANSIRKYGGRYLVRGSACELLEGQPSPKGTIIVEFPSMEIARAWYRSAEYSEALRVRERALERRLIFVQGI
jgi:uncharacterized protein (DUF1330 family)